MTNEEFIKKIKILKSIEASPRLHFSINEKISQIGDLGEIDVKNNKSMVQLLFAKPAFIFILLIAVLIGSGASIVSAAQDSLPIDALYPVKIASERAQLALTPDNIRKIDMHLRFSKRRLKEIGQMIKKQKADKKNVQATLINYNKEIGEINNILNLIDKNKLIEVSQKVASEISENEKEYQEFFIL